MDKIQTKEDLQLAVEKLKELKTIKAKKDKEDRLKMDEFAKEICLKKIIKGLKEGVQTEDGTTRNFDSIDYYELTSIDPFEMCKYAMDHLSVADFRLLKLFAGPRGLNIKGKPYNNETIDHMLKIQTIVNPEYNKNGKYIEGTGTEISLEDKLAMLSYIEGKNIPITSSTFKAGHNRLVKKILAKSEKSYTRKK